MEKAGNPDCCHARRARSPRSGREVTHNPGGMDARASLHSVDKGWARMSAFLRWHSFWDWQPCGQLTDTTPSKAQRAQRTRDESHTESPHAGARQWSSRGGGAAATEGTHLVLGATNSLVPSMVVPWAPTFFCIQGIYSSLKCEGKRIKKTRAGDEQSGEPWLLTLVGHPGWCRLQSTQDSQPLPCHLQACAGGQGCAEKVPGEGVQSHRHKGAILSTPKGSPASGRGCGTPTWDTMPKRSGSLEGQSVGVSTCLCGDCVCLPAHPSQREGRGAATYVQLHQGEQVLLGGSEDGIRLPAGDGLV